MKKVKRYVVSGLIKKGMTKEEIVKKIDGYPISKGLKLRDLLSH